MARDRAAMRAAGLRYYYRNREVRKAENKQWHLEHPGYALEWYHENRETANARARASYVRNKERASTANREYHQTHREAINARYRERYNRPDSGLRAYNLRRHFERHGLGKIDPEWLTTLLGDPCSYCGGPAGQIDHVVPISVGGRNDPDNLTAACRSCNASKKDRPVLLFLLGRK